MLIALLLIQAVGPIAPGVPAGDDVVVIGRRLQNWSGRITSNPLFTRCKTIRSTGNADIDAIGCRAMEACWPAARKGIRQVDDKRLPLADRQRIKTDTETAFGVCFKQQRTSLITELVAKGRISEGAYK